jgi:hypothetical protein
MTVHRISPIHRFFLDHPKGGKLCVQCNQLFSTKSNNSAWKKHLRTHPLQWKQYCGLNGDHEEHSVDDTAPLPAQDLPSSSSAQTPGASTASLAVAAFRFPTVTTSAAIAASEHVVDLCHDNRMLSEDAVTPTAQSRLGVSQTQQSIIESFSKAHDAVRDAAIAECFAIHSLPLSLIESPHFLSMIDKSRSSRSALPSRKTLRIEQRTLHDLRRLQVLDILSSSHVCTTIAIDGWTNVRHDKVTNILPIVEGRAYYWTSVVNSTEKNNARWLSSNLKPILDSLINNKVKVVALVMDNEAVNWSMFRQLKRDMPFLVPVPCASHTIQLCVNKILDLLTVRDVRDGMRAIFKQFEAKDKRQMLTKIQEASPHTRSLRLIRPCDTRWSSSLYAGRRLLALRKAIDMVLPDIELQFWSNLQSLCDFLEPFQIATDACQKDASTLVDVFRQFSLILQHLDHMKETNPFFASQQPAKNLILHQWKQHVNVDAVVNTAMFSFSDDYERLFTQAERDSAQTYFFTFAVEYLIFYHLTMRPADELRRVLKFQWSDLSRRQGSFEALDREISDFTSSSGRIDVKGVWGMFRGKVPELYACVTALLSITASEAAVERSFSAQDIVHSKRRNRLDDEQVEAEMFIKVNTRALSRVACERPSWQELDDEAVEAADELPAEHLFAPYLRCETEAEWAMREDGRQRRRSTGITQAEAETEVVRSECKERRDEETGDTAESMLADDFDLSSDINSCHDEAEEKYSDENEVQRSRLADAIRQEEARQQSEQSEQQAERINRENSDSRKRKAGKPAHSANTTRRKQAKVLPVGKNEKNEKMEVTVASTTGAETVTTVTVTSSRSFKASSGVPPASSSVSHKPTDATAASIGVSSRMQDRYRRLPVELRTFVSEFAAQHGVHFGQGSLTPVQNKALNAAVEASDLNITSATVNSYLRAIVQGVLFID